MRVVEEAPRPAFADELLARLERGRGRRAWVPVVRRVAPAVAATASVALLLAARRKAR